MVVGFLTRFIREADIQKVSEVLAFVALPSFLEEYARSWYETGAGLVSPEKIGVSGWPEAVHYLLRNHVCVSGGER